MSTAPLGTRQGGRAPSKDAADPGAPAAKGEKPPASSAGPRSREAPLGDPPRRMVEVARGEAPPGWLPLAAAPGGFRWRSNTRRTWSSKTGGAGGRGQNGSTNKTAAHACRGSRSNGSTYHPMLSQTAVAEQVPHSLLARRRSTAYSEQQNEAAKQALEPPSPTPLPLTESTPPVEHPTALFPQ
jgi:hypothetical protein